MPHTSGTFTVGLATSNFLTLNDAFGDYNGGAGGLTGNLTYIIEGNTTLNTALATRVIYFQKMNGFTFTITSSKYHYGVWGNGKRVTITGASDLQIQLGVLGVDGHSIIENLEFTGRRIYLPGINPGGLGGIGKHTVRNCLMSNTTVFMQYRNRNLSDNHFYNNKMFNGSFLNLAEYSGTAIQPTIVENNSFYFPPAGGVVIAIAAVTPATADSQIILRNNVIFSSLLNDISVSAYRTMPYAYNNAFSANGGTAVLWRSGSSGNINYIPTSEFESVNSSSSDFLELNKGRLFSRPIVDPDVGTKPLKCKFTSNAQYDYGGKLLPSGGLVPTLVVNDLAGEPYGKWGDYPIGCYNAEIAY